MLFVACQLTPFRPLYHIKITDLKTYSPHPCEMLLLTSDLPYDYFLY